MQSGLLGASNIQHQQPRFGGSTPGVQRCIPLDSTCHSSALDIAYATVLVARARLAAVLVKVVTTETDTHQLVVLYHVEERQRLGPRQRRRLARVVCSGVWSHNRTINTTRHGPSDSRETQPEKRQNDTTNTSIFGVTFCPLLWLSLPYTRVQPLSARQETTSAYHSTEIHHHTREMKKSNNRHYP